MSGNNQNNYGGVSNDTAKQNPLLKSTTAWVTAPCLTSGDDDFLNID